VDAHESPRAGTPVSKASAPFAGIHVGVRSYAILKLRALGPTIRPLDMRTIQPPPKTADSDLRDPAWVKLVAHLIKRRGRRCERCGKTREDDDSPVALIGDHIVERRDGGAVLDPDNVQLLCRRAGGNGDGGRGGCHSIKTAEARTERLFRR